MHKFKPISIMALTVRADIGGGPEHLYQLSRGLGDSVNVYIACPDELPYRKRYADLPNVREVFDLPHRRFRLRPLLYLMKAIRRHDIALIHSHGKGAGLYGRILAALTGRPVIYTFHGLHVGDYKPLKRKLYLLLERALGLLTEAAICVSQGERAQIIKAGIFGATKLHVIENGVVVPDAVAEPQPSATLRLVAVNRYDFQKNAELLVDIAESLRSLLEDRFRLKVLGTGENMPLVRDLITARGMESVIELSGSNENPRAVFREADIFLSTSRWEGMPLAVLEAMSEGLPVVVTDVVGNRDVVDHGRTGLLYPSEDAQMGANAVASLVDPVRRRAIGLAARDSIQNRFSVERMARQTMKLYMQAIASRASRLL